MAPTPPSTMPVRGLGRVALVAPGYPPAAGGVEQHVAQLARGLVRRGIEVEVAVCDPSGALSASSVEDGVRVHRFRTLGDDGVFNLSPSIGAWLLRNASRFTLIHAHSYHTPLPLQALVAARAAGRPFVLTPHFHGDGHTPLRRLLHVPYGPFGARVVRGSRPVVCVSRAEQALLQRRFGNDLPTVVAPNGVDVDDIRRAVPFERRRSGRLVLAAGRLEDYKRVDAVVEAMACLPAEDELVVLGTGPARDRIRTRTEQLGLGGRVRLLGHVPVGDLRRWLRTADVFVTLSAHEAFGITLLEAAVGGAGVVASAIPAHCAVADYLPPDRIRWVAADARPADVAASIAAASRLPVGPREIERVPRWSDTVDRTLDAYAIALQARRQPADGRTR